MGLVSVRSSWPGKSSDMQYDPFRSSRDLGMTWPEVKLWPWPFKVILYMVRRALTRQTQWYQIPCSIFKITDFIVEKPFWKILEFWPLGPILPNGVLPDGVHPIYGALFTHFIYSALPTFLYAFFIYGILLRRASMTCKNIDICELWLVNYYEYGACDIMRTRVTHSDSFRASESPTWHLIIWPNESKSFIYASFSLVRFYLRLCFIGHDVTGFCITWLGIVLSRCSI